MCSAGEKRLKRDHLKRENAKRRNTRNEIDEEREISQSLRVLHRAFSLLSFRVLRPFALSRFKRSLRAFVVQIVVVQPRAYNASDSPSRSLHRASMGVRSWRRPAASSAAR